MNKDMYEYSFSEFTKIKTVLKNSQTSYTINNISKELLLAWKDKIINNPSKTNKQEFVTEKIINNLITHVYQELLASNILSYFIKSALK